MVTVGTVVDFSMTSWTSNTLILNAGRQDSNHYCIFFKIMVKPTLRFQDYP